MSEDNFTAVVICIGNALAADDGAGSAVYEELRSSRLPDGTRLLFLGLGGVDILEHLEGERRLVVVDAVQIGGAPGTVHVLDWTAIPQMGPRSVSGHGIGVREAIELGRRLYPEKIPREISLVGIEGLCFDQLGADLTEKVREAVPKAAAEVISLLAL